MQFLLFFKCIFVIFKLRAVARKDPRFPMENREKSISTTEGDLRIFDETPAVRIEPAPNCTADTNRNH